MQGRLLLGVGNRLPLCSTPTWPGHGVWKLCQLSEALQATFFAFPIVCKQDDSRGPRNVSLVSIVGSRSLGQPASFWPKLGLEYAERKAQKLTGSSHPSRWQLLLSQDEPLAKYAADEHSGQLALYLAQVAMDSNLRRLPYGTSAPIWATGSIGDGGLRQEMNHQECSAKLEWFLCEPSAHLLLAPAGVVARGLNVAKMPRPITLADFEGQWKTVGYWDRNDKVIVQLEAHELAPCARCVVPRELSEGSTGYSVMGIADSRGGSSSSPKPLWAAFRGILGFCSRGPARAKWITALVVTSALAALLTGISSSRKPKPHPFQGAQPYGPFEGNRGIVTDRNTLAGQRDHETGIKPADEQPVSSSGRPSWVEEVLHHPIVPGVGFAGVRLNQEESEVIAALGRPTTPVHQVVGRHGRIFLDERAGSILKYCLGYEYQGLFLGICTDRDSRRVNSLRLKCSGRELCRSLPNYRGVGIGTIFNPLRNELGRVMKTDEHSLSACGGASKEYNATTYRYEGIDVAVCNSTSVIELLEIAAPCGTCRE